MSQESIRANGESKKLMALYLLELLRRKTDAKHTLSQSQLRELLHREYGMNAERKAVRENLRKLIDCGYPIMYGETSRMMPAVDENGDSVMEESVILTDFFYMHEFEDSELRLLIDLVSFSNYVPYAQGMELVKKLEKCGNEHFEKKTTHVVRWKRDDPGNRRMFWTIDRLAKAIEERKKVRFCYLEYGLDKQMHSRMTPDGREMEHVVTPYQMASRDGRYYLICNHDGFDDVANYRIDRIDALKILDERGRPFSEMNGSNGQPLDLGAYMREHPYMFTGESTTVFMRVTKSMVSNVIDLFGVDVAFLDETDDSVTVRVRANEKATEQFVWNYAPNVVILSPQRMVDNIGRKLKQTVEKYQKTMVLPENE